MWLSELSTYHIDRTEWLWNHTRATIYKHIGTSNRQRGKNEKNRTLASAYPFSTDLYKFQYQRHKTPENNRTKTKTTTIKYSEKYEKKYPQDMRRWVFFLLLMLNDYKRFFGVILTFLLPSFLLKNSWTNSFFCGHGWVRVINIF